MRRLFSRNEKTHDDETLVRLYRESADMTYLGVLYDRYLELVYGVCLKYFKNSARAEDAVMAIFEDLVHKLRQHEVHSFRPWLHTVARNHCLMQLRKKQPVVLPYEDLSPSAMAGHVHSDAGLHPLDVASQNGSLKPLQDCLEGLPPKQRQSIQRFYFEDKSYQDIADELALPLGMVRSQLQNGRRNLRICMEKKGFSNLQQLLEKE